MKNDRKMIVDDPAISNALKLKCKQIMNGIWSLSRPSGLPMFYSI